jgi:hypothetical protein
MARVSRILQASDRLLFGAQHLSHLLLREASCSSQSRQLERDIPCSLRLGKAFAKFRIL